MVVNMVDPAPIRDIELAIESSGLIYWDDEDMCYRVGLTEDASADQALNHIMERLAQTKNTPHK